MFNRDLFIAFIVLVVSATSAGYAYREHLRERDRNIVPIAGLAFGSTKLNFLSNTKCIGFIDYNFERSSEDSYALTGNGELRVSIAGARVNFKLSIEAFFNKLGQLGGSVFQLVSGKNQVLFGTTGTNPIEVALRFQLEGSERTERRFPIAGPISLKRVDGDLYQVQSQHFRTLGPAYKMMSEQPLISGLGLDTSPISEALDCRASEDAGLDLSPLIALLGTIEKGANFLTPKSSR